MAKLGEIFHYDLLGSREEKYEFLHKNKINSIDFVKLETPLPLCFFVKKNFDDQSSYDKGFKLTDLFIQFSAGIVTARDSFTIQNTKDEILSLIKDFSSLSPEVAREKYNLGKDVRDWKVEFAQNDLKKTKLSNENIIKVSYRLFDDKFTYYTGNSKGFHCMPRGETMKHFFRKENIGLTVCKQFKTGATYQHVFICNKIIESSYVSNRTSEITSVFPLYLFAQNDNFENSAKPNFNSKIIKEIEKQINLHLSQSLSVDNDSFNAQNLFDYIYAVLHSPSYREKYKEFLKIDFPRIPYPNIKTFKYLFKLGSELRAIHLFEADVLNNFITSYPVDGSNSVDKISFSKNRVMINASQFFDKVPETAWNFYIGGYQPAQKWLKDRKGRVLTTDEIMHYQKIIVALTETEKIMKKIDEIGVE